MSLTAGLSAMLFVTTVVLIRGILRALRSPEYKREAELLSEQRRIRKAARRSIQ